MLLDHATFGLASLSILKRENLAIYYGVCVKIVRVHLGVREVIAA